MQTAATRRAAPRVYVMPFRHYILMPCFAGATRYTIAAMRRKRVRVAMRHIYLRKDATSACMIKQEADY